MSDKQHLTFHGKSPDQCQWVIDNFENNEMYKDNLGIQLWVEASKEILKSVDVSV